MTGRMDDLLQTLGEDAPQGAEHVLVPLRSVRAGVTLIHADLLPTCLHVIRLGAFKTQVVCDDGYEQVTGFPGPSEILGLDGLQGMRHTFSAIALEDGAVYSLALKEIDDLRQRFPELDHAMQRAVSRQLSQTASLAQVMSAVSSEARLARFLLQRSRRMVTLGQSATRLRLPMSRRDIASHLGVAHETVSRSLGELTTWGCLRVRQREVELLDLDRLQTVARNTRGAVTCPATLMPDRLTH
jgi:CRP/FNR family transcriptional regulator, anaerobic regulatory protein